MDKQEQAFEEIQAVIKKYDLAAFIALHDKDGGTFRPFFPTWCEVTFREKREGGIVLHMRTKVNMENGEESIAMMLGLRDITIRASAIYENVAKSLARHLNVDLVHLLGGVEKGGQEPKEGTLVDFPGKGVPNEPKH